MKLLVVLGTRPEAIKLAPVIREARQRDGVQVRVCATGQHREMLAPVLDLFDLRPDDDLDLMRGAPEPAELAAKVLSSLAVLLRSDRPDRVVVHGDTTTAWSAAMAAFLARIPVAHVEAGLRSGDPMHPFPEEVHRRVIAQIADLHLAPTRTARDNLVREGVSPDRIVVTGNPAVDALHAVQARTAQDPPAEVRAIAAWHAATVGAAPMVLVTAHRREHFGQGLRDICAAVAELAATLPDCRFVFPVHLNPDVRGPVHAALAGHPGVRLIDPLPYAAFVWLMSRCRLVLTDSGGIQEEAPTLGIPVVLMRRTTERPEGLASGLVTLAGTATQRIVAATRERLAAPPPQPLIPNPYGDGHAARRILDAILAGTAPQSAAPGG